MKILRYTEDVQKQLKSKTKSEPWLHVAVHKRLLDTLFAIYVWDTRATIETNVIGKSIDVTGSSAVDNRAPLIGCHLSDINELMERASWTDKEKQQADFIYELDNTVQRNKTSAAQYGTGHLRSAVAKCKRMRISKPYLAQLRDRVVDEAERQLK